MDGEDGYVTFEGRFWKLEDTFLQTRPVHAKVPLYFGVGRPRMLEMTGQMADGCLPAWLVSYDAGGIHRRTEGRPESCQECREITWRDRGCLVNLA